MAIENVYSYLEYLALTVDQLADAVVEREEETAMYEVRLKELCEELVLTQKEVDKAEARAQLAEANVKKAEEKIEELTLQLKASKQTRRKVDPQMDMFAAPAAPAVPVSAAPVAEPVPVTVKTNRIANDENALILAKKLDSTIDKVQRLIREARA